MANLLSGASILTQRVIGSSLGPSAAATTAAVSQIANIQPKQIANVGINAAFSLIGGSPLQSVGASALQSVTGLGFAFGGGGGLVGTKPVPLHTEYAGSESAGDRPYSFTADIVFFLLRADQTSPANAVFEDQDRTASLPANIQAGGNPLGQAIQTPLGQLATGLAVNAALGGITKSTGGGSLVGPLTGLAASAGIAAATGSGIFSQPAAIATGGTVSAVGNAVGVGVDPLATSVSNIYSAPAQTYFSDLAASSFNPTAEAFTGGALSDLSTNLGANFPEIQSTTDLSQAFSNPEVGSATAALAAFSGDLNVGGLFGSKAALNEDATTIQSKDTIADIPKSWYFITAPQDVSWSKEGTIATADTYGTNTPYVLYGATSLRRLTLGSVLLEGFSDRKTVEANIVALETCMNMVIQNGYTAPYCWKVYAGGKNYGTFIISGVKVKEIMRDMRGYADRAVVDIELQQVPDYQVNSGRDLASRATLGGLSQGIKDLIAEQAKERETKSNAASAGRSPASAANTGAAGAQDKAAENAKKATLSGASVRPGGERGLLTQP